VIKTQNNYGQVKKYLEGKINYKLPGQKDLYNIMKTLPQNELNYLSNNLRQAQIPPANNSYEIEKNGEYTIETTDSKGRNYEINLNVENIDKISPNIVSEGKIENGIANIVAYDKKDKNGNYAESGIAKIELTYETPTQTTNWTTLDGKINEEGKVTAEVNQIKETNLAYVRATDNAGNVSSIKRITFKEEFKDEFRINESEMKSEKSNKISEQENFTSGPISYAYIAIGISIVIGIGVLMYTKNIRYFNI